MNGAASTITTGKAIAARAASVAARRATVTRGEDNSTTGSSVMAHIAHSDTMSTLKQHRGERRQQQRRQEGDQREAACGLARATAYRRWRAMLGRVTSAESTTAGAM